MSDLNNAYLYQLVVDAYLRGKFDAKFDFRWADTSYCTTLLAFDRRRGYQPPSLYSAYCDGKNGRPNRELMLYPLSA